jgi:hypothetical protein
MDSDPKYAMSSLSRDSPDAASNNDQDGQYWRFAQAGCRFHKRPDALEGLPSTAN